MISLDPIVGRYGDRTLFLSHDGAVSYRQFQQKVETIAQGLPDNPCGQVQLDWSADAFARLLATVMKGGIAILAESCPAEGLGAFKGAAPLLVLRTGGTTGAPRHVVHSINSLMDRYRVLERPEQRLVVLYGADHIAGLDAFFQALHRGATLVVPDGRDAHSVVQAIEQHQVDVIPATPTFLQFLLLGGSLDNRKLSSVKAIPHGAEPMPHALRLRLKVVFPNARLLHRFGLTELGALPVRVDDEDPDALFLDEAGFDWKVEEGELWIKSPSRMLGTIEEGPVEPGQHWHRTGDLAELTPRGSVRILGRREAIINVGGEKVIPEQVETLILGQDGVLDASVCGVPNPLTGQAVTAKVVFAGEPDSMGLLRALRSAIREAGLGLAHVPTRIEAVESIAKTATGKRSRTQGKT
jgi:acyl-coenzyme A synthetase/AMP-(fatty) acid ligase